MTIEEAKEWLSQGKKIQWEIERLERQYNKAVSCAVNLTVRLKDVPGIAIGDKRGDDHLIEYASRDEYTKLIQAQIAHLQQVQFEISRVIYAVKEGILRRLLLSVYIADESLERFSADENYCYRHSTRLHKEALQAVCDIMSLNVPLTA